MNHTSNEKYDQFTMRWPFIRGVISFFGGFSGIVFLLVTGSDQLAWVPVFIGMMGLPVFTRSDEKSNAGNPK